MSQMQMSQEQQMKMALLQSYESMLSNLGQFLNKLPLDAKFKDFCFMNLDQSAFWARQAISNMEIKFSEPQAPVAESTEENKVLEEKANGEANSSPAQEVA